MKFKFYFNVSVLIIISLAIHQNIFSQVKQRTVNQIQKLLLEKNSRNPAQRKMSSHLLQLIRENSGRQMADGVPLRPSLLRADAGGKLEIDINANVTDDLLRKIRSLGGIVIYSYPQFHSVRVRVNPSVMETIAGYPEVKLLKPAEKVISVDAGHFSGPDERTALNIPFPGAMHKKKSSELNARIAKYLQHLLIGSVNSEGDVTQGASDAKNIYGYLGQGVKIGVLSTSLNTNGGVAADIQSGDLPGPGNPLGNTTPITVLQDSYNTDEGRGLLEIIHDIAPKAQLFFAAADFGQANYAYNILQLRYTYHCDIIIDDAFYFGEPVFQDGIIAQAVNSVTANGALYFASAGNFNSAYRDIPGSAGVWEGDFNDNGSPSFVGAGKSGTVHNFGTVSAPEVGDSLVNGSSYGGYTLNWADPLGGSGNDYDLFLVNAAGDVKFASTGTQDGSQDPVEVIDLRGNYTDLTGFRLVVFKSSGAETKAFSLNTIEGILKYGTIGETHGHSNCASAISVAATDVAPAYPNRFSTSSLVETFSSKGPRRMFFNADSSAVTPDNFLYGTNGGLLLNKPDLTAADGVSTNWITPFYGTSAASPNAGAIAALLKSAKPSLTAAEIKSILFSTALDIESPGYDNSSGYGIIQADKAMEYINPIPFLALNLGVVTATEGNHSDHNGVIDSGETGNLLVELKLIQNGQTSAIPVHTVLSTVTPGVNIVQGLADYSIAPGGTDVNSSAPFIIAVNPGIKCGTVINFILNSNLSDGASGFQKIAFPITIGPAVCPVVAQCTSPLLITNPGGSILHASGVKAFKEVFTASGGSSSGNYIFTQTGDLPGGLFFSGDSLYGRVTESGNFQFAIAAQDPAGCMALNNYTVTSVGYGSPSSLKVAGGNSQSAMIGNSFPNTFKVKVFNTINNKALRGARVTFSAPSNPLLGTFSNGNTTVSADSDSTGVATAPVFIAKNFAGSYVVTATAHNVTAIQFSLKNTCIPTVVTTTADDGQGSLRYIIANACAGAKITFASGVNRINLTSGEIAVSKPLAIKGPGANLLTISGSNQSRIFDISLNPTDTLNISGVTISDGLVPADSLHGGGGILINGGTVNIQSCLIEHNNASLCELATGGGIDIETGIVNIIGSSLIQNVAGYFGGGISFNNPSNSNGSLQMINSTVYGNLIHATDGISSGGGFYTSSPYISIGFNSSTVFGNSANRGGNLYCYRNNPTVRNTIIAGGIIPAMGSGPDLWGNINSQGYNLIQDLSGGNMFNGLHDITAVSPNLFPLSNYGGNIPTLLPQPNSPAINAGDTTHTTITTDERGFKRLVKVSTDIGAVETNYKSVSFSGTPQSALINTKFATALQGLVTESGNPVAGVNVIFNAPVKGAGGLFSGGFTNVAVITNAQGIAMAPDFTANSISGSYVVLDSIGTSLPKIKFSLTNTKIGSLSTGSLSATQTNETGMSDNPFLVYPNPGNNIVTILFPGEEKQMVNIFDANGRLISSTPNVIGSLNISVVNWAIGFYYITVSNGNKMNTLKFMKN